MSNARKRKLQQQYDWLVEVQSIVQDKDVELDTLKGVLAQLATLQQATEKQIRNKAMSWPDLVKLIHCQDAPTQDIGWNMGQRDIHVEFSIGPKEALFTIDICHRNEDGDQTELTLKCDFFDIDALEDKKGKIKISQKDIKSFFKKDCSIDTEKCYPNKDYKEILANMIDECLRQLQERVGEGEDAYGMEIGFEPGDVENWLR